MGHHHHHHHDENSKNMGFAFFLNLSFTIVEIIGGLLTNSIAILSDALHDLGDSISLGLGWFLQRFSNKEQTNDFTFGYKRFSLLAALINSVVLIVGSVFILTEAIPRLFQPESPNATGMLMLAILGVIVNGAAVFKLRGGDTMNAKVMTWHLLEDVLGWVAVLIVSIVLMFKDIPILDPLLSVGITVYILYNVIINFKKTMILFLEGVPEEVDMEDIQQKLLDITNVKSIHHTHVWSLDGEQHAFSTHVVVTEDVTKEGTYEVKQAIKRIIQAYHFSHITVEIEYEGEGCIIEHAHQHE
ncbi:cation diffusion facilitator family transporter [Pontibacillus litoralis]|uniref:Cobalt transporter n=1 Tax=Pontibacillus litoralis JSM 072002 TaxID=1385512 RepID=A0A0A5G749_9BACI|nr:cation diffusion facilitator family transporter [Pontibacillus litoralis]KGX86925.1 cobalt transporter [Pontibacillus litoralis JSM 072002]